jgi:hypothetical protein
MVEWPLAKQFLIGKAYDALRNENVDVEFSENAEEKRLIALIFFQAIFF